VLSEIGVLGDRPATREGARRFRLALEELGTTYIKLWKIIRTQGEL
jgi:predicted unusual protein kinase regulating ubiquinone biosynthesis (AarF/ABC1/UbiB family)